MKASRTVRLVPLIMISGLVAACGGSGSSSNPAPTTTATPSVSAGDIADTATYLRYHGSGFSLEYVEGWGIQLTPKGGVTISDKDSSEIVRIVPTTETPVTFASQDLSSLSHSQAKYHLLSNQTTTLPAGSALRAQYRALSPPDPVTGKRVSVVVDRYYVPGSGKLAVITLSTPVGVDNVDAFRRIARSFRWH